MERFVSEMITVDVNSMTTAVLATGAPSCPKRFCWRGKWYEIDTVIEQWKRSVPEGGRPNGEKYVRSHCFRVHTLQGVEAVIYCDRQQSKKRKSGWWLYTINKIDE